MCATTSFKKRLTKKQIIEKQHKISIKVLKTKNQVLAEANLCQEEQIKWQAVYYDHCQNVIRDYQCQVDTEKEAHKTTKDLLMVSLNLFVNQQWNTPELSTLSPPDGTTIL